MTAADGSDSRSVGPTIVAVNVFAPGLSATSGTRKCWVSPTGTSVDDARVALADRDVDPDPRVGLPDDAAGIVPTRSTDGWFVYGSSGASSDGASAATGSGALRAGVAVMSRDEAVERRADRRRRSCRGRRWRTAGRRRRGRRRPRPTGAGRGGRCPGRGRSVRWAASRPGAGAAGRTLSGRGASGRRRPGPYLGWSPASPCRHRRRLSHAARPRAAEPLTSR